MMIQVIMLKSGQYCTNQNVGNFLELINFGIRKGDVQLKDCYENHAKNASYLFTVTQDEIIE